MITRAAARGEVNWTLLAGCDSEFSTTFTRSAWGYNH